MARLLEISVTSLSHGQRGRPEPIGQTVTTDDILPSTAAPQIKLARDGDRDPTRPTVFHQSWWLEAATEGACREVTVARNGFVVGRLPFVVKQRFGLLTHCSMPPLTPFLGPGIDAGRGSAANRSFRRNQITRDLLAQLPDTGSTRLKMHAGIGDMLVFQDCGFDVSAQFSHEIAPASPQAIWLGMRDKTRNVIRRAQDEAVLVPLDGDGFASLYGSALTERNERSHYGGDLIRRLAAAALGHNQGRILAASKADGRLTAAVFVVWDERSAYYFMSTRRKGSGNGAVSMLVWAAIQDAAERGLRFDFNGVGTSGSIMFYAGFGGTVSPRYIAARAAPLSRAAFAVAHAWRPRPKFI